MPLTPQQLYSESNEKYHLPPITLKSFDEIADII